MSFAIKDKRKRKKRPRNYLAWGDPEEDETPVPWYTLKRHDQLPLTSKEVETRGNNECFMENSLIACPEPVKNKPEVKDFSDPNFNFSEMDIAVSFHTSSETVSKISSKCGSFDETLSNVASECGSSAEDYCINSPHDSSEEEEIAQQEVTQQEPIAAASHQVVVDNRPPAFQNTMAKLMQNQFSSVVTANACISPREILLNLLNLTETHDVNNTVFVGLCKFVNSIFNEPILPDSQYKLDELLLSTCGMKYNFYCSKCFKFLMPKDSSKTLTCECGFVNDVADLTKASYFVSFDICTQLEIVLRDPKIASQLLDIKSYSHIDPGMHDLYDGEAYQHFRNSLDFSDGATHISLTFCADGSPLYKSSNADIWPLLASVNELPPLIRMKKTLLLGLWFGKGKPHFELFFKPVVKKVIQLSDHGATINIGGKQTFVKVDCISCCVDSGVRGTIQGVHLHNGVYGCNWCLHPGEVEGQGSSARKYRYFENSPALRTHHQVERDARIIDTFPPARAPSAPKPQVNGVIASSPLLKLPHFDIVNGLILDAMHNSFLGTTRQFLRLWCGLEGNLRLPNNTYPSYYIGAPTTLERINRRIALLVPPVEVRRLPRPLSDLVHFKAHELENFLFYFLVPVLKGILPDRFVKHMTLYVQGMYLLMKDVVLPEDLAVAEFLLEKFVQEIQELYENPNFSKYKQYTYNVHLSLHAVQNARRWGNAWSISGYAFENAIGILKKTVHANKGIPNQVARSLCKSNVRDLLAQEIKSARCASFLNEITPQKSVNVCFVGDVKVFGMSSQKFYPNEEEAYLLYESSLEGKDFSVAKKLLYNGSLFAPKVKANKTRNDFAQRSDGNIVQIKKIIVSEKLQVVLLFYSIVHVTPYPVHVAPHLSLKSPFLYNVELIEQEQYLSSYTSLSNKPCVYSDLRALGGTETLSVMANVMNVF